MINEDLAKEIGNVLEKDSQLARQVGMKPVTSPALATVTDDIDALKRKLETIAKGIMMLRGQL